MRNPFVVESVRDHLLLRRGARWVSCVAAVFIASALAAAPSAQPTSFSEIAAVLKARHKAFQTFRYDSTVKREMKVAPDEVIEPPAITPGVVQVTAAREDSRQYLSEQKGAGHEVWAYDGAKLHHADRGRSVQHMSNDKFPESPSWAELFTAPIVGFNHFTLHELYDQYFQPKGSIQEVTYNGRPALQVSTQMFVNILDVQCDFFPVVQQYYKTPEDAKAGRAHLEYFCGPLHRIDGQWFPESVDLRIYATAKDGAHVLARVDTVTFDNVAFDSARIPDELFLTAQAPDGSKRF